MKEVDEKVEMREASLYSQDSKGESVFSSEWLMLLRLTMVGLSCHPIQRRKRAARIEEPRDSSQASNPCE